MCIKTDTPPDYHCRNYLPHIERRRCQMITFRLHDSVPASVVQQWKERIETDKKVTDDEASRRLLVLIDNYEDAGYGSCLLREGRVANIVKEALQYFDEDRYRLLAWCIMPNHVHVLIEQLSDVSLSVILHSWRSYTSKKINKMLCRTGKVWMPEYFDRYIRDSRHFDTAVRYILNNPVKAGLCTLPSQFQWSSAYGMET